MLKSLLFLLAVIVSFNCYAEQDIYILGFGDLAKEEVCKLDIKGDEHIQVKSVYEKVIELKKEGEHNIPYDCPTINILNDSPVEELLAACEEIEELTQGEYKERTVSLVFINSELADLAKDIQHCNP